MSIIAKLKPLYEDLKMMGVHKFVEDSEFIRICNELNITDHYAQAHNDVLKDKDAFMIWLSQDTQEGILIGLLNKLFTDTSIEFASVVCEIVALTIPNVPPIPSIKSLRRDLQLLGATILQLNLIDESWHREDVDYYKKVLFFKELLMARAQGQTVGEEHYKGIRESLISNALIKDNVPEYVLKCDSVKEFWSFIKAKFGSYAERRTYLTDSLEPLIRACRESNLILPHHDIVSNVALQVSENYIIETWRKALGRMRDDPEAAITSARSLIEQVCKHILDEVGENYDDTTELPKLYKLTASRLNLAPDQHTEQLFKQILGGCQTVVEGLGALRNKLGDAHGNSKAKVRPSERHAALAVNLSGSMCSFLLQTYLHSLNGGKQKK